MEFDERYLSLMDIYKQLRRDPEKSHLSEKALDAATSLMQTGKVSEEARETARYM